MGRLEKKVAIVTGAGGGIGKATALLFAKEGAKVAVACRGSEKGEKTVSEINNSGGEAIFVQTDVSRTEDVKRMISETVAAFGKLNVLFNNAAIAIYEPLLDSKEEDFDNIVAINLKGVWLGMKFAIPEMIKAGGGSIINAASIAADAAQRGSSIYAATKGGVISMSRVAAVEHAAQNIRVNCLKPGAIITPMLLELCNKYPEVRKRIEANIPQGRLGEVEEAAQVALFLASDESSHVTGQKITVDGGVEADSHLV